MYRMLHIGTALVALIATDVLAHTAHTRAPHPAPVQLQLGSGALVESVDPGSAAERAGLRAGDRIVAIDGHPINDHAEVDPFVASGGGRVLTLHVRRGGSIVRLRATPRLTAVPTRR